MSISENIRKDMFTASKEGRTDESDILKMALAAIKNAEIDSEKELTDEDVEKILRKEARKVTDAIDQYTKMGREDLLAKEKAQLEILDKYLPQLLTEEEVRVVVKNKIIELGITEMKDMGRLMGAVMAEIGTLTDGNTVKNIVSELLK
ncbi:TPA: glutamyl-tRNA amidotransferase [Patescibacteria group bacterium]|nr:glutamyl-tRNA amidotransferase [Patescibacteria group bacterium]